MRAYAIHRPFGIGTWPAQYGGFPVNFDTYRFVEEIGRHAFGYVDFQEDVPKEMLEKFDLVTENPAATAEQLMIDKVADLLVRYVDDDEHFSKVWNTAVRMGYDEEKLADAFNRKYEEMEG